MLWSAALQTKVLSPQGALAVSFYLGRETWFGEKALGKPVNFTKLVKGRRG